LTAAAFFSGACEQPARLALDDRALLMEWKPSYRHGAAMQAPLALIGSILGCIAWWQTGNWRWLLGAAALISAWLYTLIVIRPTNDRLNATKPEDAGPESRTMIRKWGLLHLVRAGQGVAATLCSLWALA
jgi:hypothetical protein